MSEPTYWITRFLFQRALGVIYLVGFLIVWNQFVPLCGDHGITPARLYMQRLSFWDAPSLFWWRSGDAVFKTFAGVGLVFSVTAVAGITDAFSTWFSALCWFALWAIYSSFVNIGGTFYGFGWEIMLGEVGFIAIFLGSMRSPPSVVTIWLLRWVLFRLMFGAGLIKIRGDECWRNLTCMEYHYETQPLPGPLSWWFHWRPAGFHKLEVAFTHFVELLVPFAYFGTRPFRHWAGILTIVFQLTLIATGNLSWLNCITIVVAIACFDDSAFRWLLGLLPPAVVGGAAQVAGMPMFAIWAFTVVVAVLSVRPVLNLLSPGQAMNASFDPFHLVNTYGAFGSITKTRYEIILEGTRDPTITPATKWVPYEFKGKPGDPARRPPQVTPYHYKLDWQMWFAAMSSYQYHPWILNLVAKLLKADPATLSLLGPNPFPGGAPTSVRAELYEYHYTKPGERDGKWWRRERVGAYLPPLSLSDPQFAALLDSQGWND